MNSPKLSDGQATVEKVVVILGDFSHEGLNAKIQGLGFSLVRKQFRSSPKNWAKFTAMIQELRHSGRLASVLAYVPTPTLLHISSAEYAEARDILLNEVEQSAGLFFIHEDNFSGKIEPAPWQINSIDEEDFETLDVPWPTDYSHSTTDTDLSAADALLDAARKTRIYPGEGPIDPPPINWPQSKYYAPTREEWLANNEDEIRSALVVLQDLQARKIPLVPFRTRSDVTLRIFEALEDAQAGIFLRLYVPHGRYQSEQFEYFLTMFSRYLREVEGKEFSVDSQRTARGTTYVFKGRGEVVSVSGLEDACGRFDQFLTLAAEDPPTAEKLLDGKVPGKAEIPFIVAKYARNIRRLNLDIKHEHARRRLLLSQELEADLLESQEQALLPMPSENSPSSLFSIMGNYGPVTVNIDSGMAGRIGNALPDRATRTVEDENILSLIQDIEDKVEALRLQSDLDRLKDKATQPEEKRTAVQRLKSLVYASGKYAFKKADEIGTEILIKYLERQLENPGG